MERARVLDAERRLQMDMDMHDELMLHGAETNVVRAPPAAADAAQGGAGPHGADATDAARVQAAAVAPAHVAADVAASAESAAVALHA